MGDAGIVAAEARPGCAVVESPEFLQSRLAGSWIVGSEADLESESHRLLLDHRALHAEDETRIAVLHRDAAIVLEPVFLHGVNVLLLKIQDYVGQNQQLVMCRPLLKHGWLHLKLYGVDRRNAELDGKEHHHGFRLLREGHTYRLGELGNYLPVLFVQWITFPYFGLCQCRP